MSKNRLFRKKLHKIPCMELRGIAGIGEELRRIAENCGELRGIASNCEQLQNEELRGIAWNWSAYFSCKSDWRSIRHPIHLHKIEIRWTFCTWRGITSSSQASDCWYVRKNEEEKNENEVKFFVEAWRKDKTWANKRQKQKMNRESLRALLIYKV